VSNKVTHIPSGDLSDADIIEWQSARIEYLSRELTLAFLVDEAKNREIAELIKEQA